MANIVDSFPCKIFFYYYLPVLVFPFHFISHIFIYVKVFFYLFVANIFLFTFLSTLQQFFIKISFLCIHIVPFVMTLWFTGPLTWDIPPDRTGWGSCTLIARTVVPGSGTEVRISIFCQFPSTENMTSKQCTFF